ncbi:GNAT family N-acetyltransferase [Palleronia caenipelagi]|uniref:GNAT family N-acetyltransferase n=1 Tax=Palleronia caenipelagi TaxID=2489174 RepID=A0A547Q726_9RHOB|nr:GNAT family N-acetyltransferase [Palleronia caenipelagi]TRD22188.1 GNAT family N-acetyltransferase [Palleronia caenipelagi]
MHEIQAAADLSITRASRDDAPAIWAMLEPAFRAGDSYAVDPEISRHAALDYWFREGNEVWLAGEGLGTYYLRPNQPGPGDHVCNAGFVTAATARGRGVARMMLAHALVRAKEAGYHAMQFNFVLATNTRALAIWQSHQFDVIGRVPQAFRHPAEGLVDALILYRKL